MKRIIETEQLTTKLFVEKRNEQIRVAILLTNNTDEPLTVYSSNGSWAEIMITDENEVNRLDSVLSVAAMTKWEVQPDNPLVKVRTVNTKEEAKEEFADVPFADYHFDPDNSAEDTYFAPHINLPEEQNKLFTVSVRTDLSDYSTEFAHTFKPSGLSKEERLTEYIQS